MSDKSPLEKDIERHELVKTPARVLVLFAFMLLGLGVLGIYSFKLRQELFMNRQEIVLIKSNFEKKSAELLNRIRMLEKENEALKFNVKHRDEKSGNESESGLTKIGKHKAQ